MDQDINNDSEYSESSASDIDGFPGEAAITSHSNQLSKPRRVKGMVRSDGCILPNGPPRLEADGRFRRPAGRCPVSMEWDAVQGLWAPKSRRTSALGKTTNAPNDDDDDDDGGYNYQESSNESSWEDDEPLATFRNKKHNKKQNKRKAAAVSPSKRPLRTKEESSTLEDLHDRSIWREPDRDDGLTLYERHRKPRPVIRGRVKRPLKDVLQEFRCVICLGCIQNAMVAECLHRFCEECIDRAMRVGRNECPICRVAIPSRRSLAPDPGFDRLIRAILGQNAGDADVEDDSDSNEEHRVKAVTLQRAILRKKEDVEANVPETNSAPEARMATRNTTTPSNTPHREGSPGQQMFSAVLDIALLRHEKETNLDDLDLPYLRLEEKTTIAVIKTFLMKKLGRPDVAFQIYSFSEKGKPVIFTDWMTLSAVASTFASSSQHIVHLYYRVEPPRKRPGRAIFM